MCLKTVFAPLRRVTTSKSCTKPSSVFKVGHFPQTQKGVLGLLLTPCRLRFCCKAILQTSQGVWNGLVHDCSTLLIYLDENSRKTKHFQTIFTLSKVSSLNFRAKNAGDSFFSIFGAKIQIFFVTRFARNNVKRDFFADFQILCFLLSSIFSLDRIPVFSPRLGPNDLPHFVWISVANHRFTCIQTIGCQ